MNIQSEKFRDVLEKDGAAGQWPWLFADQVPTKTGEVNLLQQEGNGGLFVIHIKICH